MKTGCMSTCVVKFGEDAANEERLKNRLVGHTVRGFDSSILRSGSGRIYRHISCWAPAMGMCGEEPHGGHMANDHVWRVAPPTHRIFVVKKSPKIEILGLTPTRL